MLIINVKCVEKLEIIYAFFIKIKIIYTFKDLDDVYNYVARWGTDLVVMCSSPATRNIHLCTLCCVD